MAKNKQKVSTQPQTTKNLDISDPRKAERFVSGEFEVSRQYLKKIRKEHPERKNVLEETEMVEPLYSRRIRAAANYLPVMLKRFEKYQNVKLDDYTVFFEYSGFRRKPLFRFLPAGLAVSPHENIQKRKRSFDNCRI